RGQGDGQVAVDAEVEPFHEVADDRSRDRRAQSRLLDDEHVVHIEPPAARRRLPLNGHRLSPPRGRFGRASTYPPDARVLNGVDGAAHGRKRSRQHEAPDVQGSAPPLATLTMDEGREPAQPKVSSSTTGVCIVPSPEISIRT